MGPETGPPQMTAPGPDRMDAIPGDWHREMPDLISRPGRGSQGNWATSLH
jgi:hypothetical protein